MSYARTQECSSEWKQAGSLGTAADSFVSEVDAIQIIIKMHVIIISAKKEHCIVLWHYMIGGTDLR